MKLVTISVYVSVDMCSHEDEITFEVLQHATEEDIEIIAEQECNDWASNYIEKSFSIIKTEQI